MTWEEIDRSATLATERAEVPGDWLVRMRGLGYNANEGESGLAFVPDPLHEWDGKSIDA